VRSYRCVVGVIASVTLVLAACTTPAASPGASDAAAATGGGAAAGGTVRIGIGGSPDSLNPGNGVLQEAYVLYELVYDTPIGLDATGAFVPELATDWSVSDDGLTWTLNIVEGATFHDGEPLTAADIAFSILLYQATEDFPFLPSYTDVFEAVEATSDTTLEITTSDPVGNFESRMAFMYVLPQHVWEAVEDPVAFENEEMIGSGPFSLVENRQGEFTRLAANKDHFATPPNVDEVIFQTFANADARVQALTEGDVDMITEFPATAISALQNAENVEVLIADVAAGGSLRDIIFNMVDPENCPPDDGVCSGHPALRDLTVRQALATAFDKDQIIEVATLNTGSRGYSMVPPGLGDFFPSEPEDYPFEPETAAQMLEDAGYRDSDGDGVRECLPEQDCEDLTFRFNYADDIDSAPREADLIQGMWEQIGVAIEIQGLDPDTLTSVCCPSFDFDVILWGWGSDPDPQFLLGVALCGEIPSGFSETGYCNREYDELYDQQGIETDHETRVGLIHDMQRILVADAPYIIPYYEGIVQAYRTDTFTGWVIGETSLGLEDPISLTVIRPAD